MLIKRWIPSPFRHPRSASDPLDMVIIHHIGSKGGKLYGVGGAVAWFTNEELHRNKKTGKIENKVSAHYIIPREPYEGRSDMIALVRHDEVAYHAGKSSWVVGSKTRTNINRYSIGIELEGDGNLVEYTDFQYERLAELVKGLMDEYGIPEENIVGHEDIAPGRKVDPGRHFDWKRFRTDLRPPQKEEDEPAAAMDGPAVPDRDFHMDGGEQPRGGLHSLIQAIIRIFVRH